MSQIDPHLAVAAQGQQYPQGSQRARGTFSGPLPRIRPANETPYLTPTQSHQQPPPQHPQQQPYYPPIQPSAHAHDVFGAALRSPLPSARPGVDGQDCSYVDLNSPANASTGDADDPKRPRACEACRTLKVRCDPDPSNDPDAPCKRCAKAKRQCITTAPSRKRQKKTDSRVAELEKKIDALTASLHAQGSTRIDSHGPRQRSPQSSPTQGRTFDARYDTRFFTLDSERPSDSHGLPLQPAYSPRQSYTGLKRRAAGSPTSNQQKRDIGTDIPGLGSTDLNERIDAIVDADHARRIFEHYIEDMVRHMPVVAFTAGTSAESVRNSKPVLFLSIITAASVGMLDIERQQKLHAMLLGVFADCIIRNGEKSMELVQALVVATIWYRPPKRFERMNFYQLNHIAAVMAIDVGMGKKLHQSKVWRMGVGAEHMKQKHVLNADQLDARRTWLGCYFLCSNSAMSLRRPNLVRWTGYMDECIQLLETSPSALPTDRTLCQHVKIQHINEDIGAQFCMDDPTAKIAITDLGIQAGIKNFERQLRDWDEHVPAHIMTPVLEFSRQTCCLYMHEVAMHIDHNIDDFRAPFTEESLRAGSGNSDVLSPAHSQALTECVKAAHGIFRTFLSFDLTTVRSLPILFFVRTAYAVVVMIKLYFAVTAPDSQVGQNISKDDLDVEGHLDRLLGAFKRMGGEDSFRPANKFLIILGKLREWFWKNRDVKVAPNKKSSFNPWAAAVAADDAMQDPVKFENAHDAKQGNSRHGSGASQQQVAQAQQTREYNSRTPLHFLSDVATSSDTSQQQVQQQTVTQQAQYPEQPSTEPAWNSAIGGPTSYDTNSGLMMELGTGFEQAIDIALGGGDGTDLSSLFMNDADWLNGSADIMGTAWGAQSTANAW